MLEVAHNFHSDPTGHNSSWDCSSFKAWPGDVSIHRQLSALANQIQCMVSVITFAPGVKVMFASM